MNKPYLPLAAGDMTPEFANLVVWGTGVAALAIGVASGSAPLLATLAVRCARPSPAQKGAKGRSDSIHAPGPTPAPAPSPNHINIRVGVGLLA